MSRLSKLNPELRAHLKELALNWQPSVGRTLLARLWQITKRHNSHLQAKAHLARRQEQAHHE